MGSAIEILIGFGGLLGLFVGVIQLYKWYWPNLKAWFLYRKEKRLMERVRFYQYRLAKMQSSDFVVERAIRSAFLFILSILLLTLGFIIGISAATELGVPPLSIIPDESFVAKLKTMDPYFIAARVGEFLIAGGCSFLLLSTSILYQLSKRSSEIDRIQSFLKDLKSRVELEDNGFSIDTHDSNL